jgi:hypothetical protein
MCVDTLDRYKDFEIQSKVFQHCDAGAYMSSFRESLSSKGNGQSTLIGNTDDTSRSRALGRSRLLSGERYIDGGLVLPTKPTMDLATAFTLETSKWTHVTLLKSSTEKNKGSRRVNPSNTGRLLVQLMRDNRLYELSFRVLNRICELDRRFVNHDIVKEGNRQHLDYYWETLQKLLQNVSFSSAVK